MKRAVRISGARLAAVLRREADVLEAVRVLTAASRESTSAVLHALDRTLRVLDPALDAVLIFVPDDDDLVCCYAAGARAERFGGMRLRRDDANALPARAAICGHRVAPSGELRALIPTDAQTLAVPMIAANRVTAVVYLGALHAHFADADVLVRTVAHAAAPYAIACEREADRASATYDALTGLHTPRAFRQRLAAELDGIGASRSSTISLWFLDTDRFKQINDSFGHAAGDAVLQQMAALLREHTIAGVDLAARNGGDEFCAIVRDTGKLASIERAQRLCEAVAAFDFGFGVALTASIGVAAYPYDAASASELLEVADAAMYHSKRSGRNCVSYCSQPGVFGLFSSGPKAAAQAP